MTGIRLADYDLDDELGFLPGTDPLRSLPTEYAEWDEIGAALPKHLVMGRGRDLLRDVPQLDIAGLRTTAELERAMLLLSYFAHGYLNDTDPPAQVLPASIALPWHAVATRLGRPPILSYASHQFHNWGRFDSSGPVALGNLTRLQDFLGGMDDDWFVMVHVAIEAAAAPGLNAMIRAQDAVLAGDAELLAERLREVAASLGAMQHTLDRMPERCDPYVYYHRVRRFLFGTKNNPAFPEGLVYEGVVEYGGKPQQFSGETGAQSAIIPFLATALGIEHQDDPLNDYMFSLRDYMPRGHRAFIEEAGSRADIRGAVLAWRTRAACEAYNECIDALRSFHHLHLRYAAAYVHRQGQKSDANSSSTGTGGTPFMKYLKLHLDNIATHTIEIGRSS
ncbi:PrnB family protein [Actinomadura montaniterrae]|uniref:Indoleamine 2,3-dioxygenase n=1 Tax=Actinomadura montaniterrae TaxID=1803903 RepID=A0A6L3W4C7_9ACTN|nr:hypothetical protein [Actinomadura montaniterrae]KAB2383680.1 hypothetical protein F9B16_11545 [Actinomadura montaniterrae]